MIRDPTTRTNKSIMYFHHAFLNGINEKCRINYKSSRRYPDSLRERDTAAILRRERIIDTFIIDGVFWIAQELWSCDDSCNKIRHCIVWRTLHRSVDCEERSCVFRSAGGSGIVLSS